MLSGQWLYIETPWWPLPLQTCSQMTEKSYKLADDHSEVLVDVDEWRGGSNSSKNNVVNNKKKKSEFWNLEWKKEHIESLFSLMWMSWTTDRIGNERESRLDSTNEWLEKDRQRQYLKTYVCECIETFSNFSFKAVSRLSHSNKLLATTANPMFCSWIISAGSTTEAVAILPFRFYSL